MAMSSVLLHVATIDRMVILFLISATRRRFPMPIPTTTSFNAPKATR